MKVCVISDSHGNRKNLEILLKENYFDYVFFLGDGLSDLRNLDNLQIKKVCGNCDLFSNEPITQTFFLENKKILLTHGHTFKVKINNELLIDYAKKNNVNLVLYGHTHKQNMQTVNGIVFLNPGAFKENKYAVINIDKKGIGIDFFVFNSNNE